MDVKCGSSLMHLIGFKIPRMSKLPKRIGAQRKFAQGAYVPPSINSNIVRADVPAPSTSKNKKGITFNNVSAKSLLDLVAFNNLHVHRHPVVVLERCDTSAEKNGIATSNEPKSSPQKNMQKPFPISNPEQKKATPHTTPYKKTRSKPMTKSSTMCLRSKSQVQKQVGRRCKKIFIRRIAIPVAESNRKHEESDEDERPLKYLKNDPKTSVEPAQTTLESKEKPRHQSEKRIRFFESHKTISDGAPKVAINIQIVKPSTIEQGPSSTDKSAQVSDSASAHRGSTQDKPEREAVVKISGVIKLGSSKTTSDRNDAATLIASKSNPSGKSIETESGLVPIQYYGRNEIHKWIDAAVEPNVTMTRCPIEDNLNLRSAYHALTYIKDRFCGKCSNCRRFTKIDKLSKLMQIPHKPADDVYEFNAEREASNSGPLTYRKRGENRALEAAAGSSNEHSKYFDFLPPGNPHYILQLRLVEFQNKENKNQKIIRANLVPKSADIQTEDILLAEHEELVDGLIRFMTDTVTKPVYHSESGVQNEALTVNSKPTKTSTRQTNPGPSSLQEEAPAAKSKPTSMRQTNSEPSGLQNEWSAGNSKPTKTSTRQTNPGPSSLQEEAPAAKSKPTSMRQTNSEPSGLQNEWSAGNSKPTKTFTRQTNPDPSSLQEEAPAAKSKPTSMCQTNSEPSGLQNEGSAGNSKPTKTSTRQTNSGPSSLQEEAPAAKSKPTSKRQTNPEPSGLQNEGSAGNSKPTKTSTRQTNPGPRSLQEEAPTAKSKPTSKRQTKPEPSGFQNEGSAGNSKHRKMSSLQNNPGPSGLQEEATAVKRKPTSKRQTNPELSSLQNHASPGNSKHRKTSTLQNNPGPTRIQEEIPAVQSKSRKVLKPKKSLAPIGVQQGATPVSSKLKKTTNTQNTPGPSGVQHKATVAKSNITNTNTPQSCSLAKYKNIKVSMPKNLMPGEVVEAPTFHLSEADFNDPIAFFEKVMPVAAKFGLCKVVAPDSFKPTCVLNDEIKFKVTNQYIARLYSRWGPAAREMTAIKAYLATQNVQFTRAPLREGLELNLPKLYHIVQRNGGLKQVIEKKRWTRVAEEMNLTKGSNPEKALDLIYVKYLLPYDILSNQERQQIMKSVEKFWNKKNQKLLDWANNPLHRQKKLLGESESESSDDDDDEADESPEVAAALLQAEDCVMQGRQMALPSFKKVATKAMQVNFPDSLTPTTREVETEYWRLVLLGTEHVCVNSASIDTGDGGYGFSKSKADPCSRHPWNLKMLSQNPLNVLASLGAVLGVTVPTFHLGMAFSTSCWHRDPHMLPWVEYMHNGPAKIWYGIPNEQSANFRKAVETLCPTSCQNKSIWLPSDITMIPPNLLREHRVSLSRVEQKPGEFIIVLPMAYSCSISTGYTESESVYFATKSWFNSMHQVFQEVRDSCEPTTFSLEQLLIALARDPRVPLSVLQQAHASLSTIVDEELRNRNQIVARGVHSVTRNQENKRPGTWNVREQDECEICRTTLYLSMVTGLIGKKSSVCLQHALRLLEMPKNKNLDVSGLELVIFYAEDKLSEIITAVQKRLSH